jgi:hypothetical protein
MTEPTVPPSPTAEPSEPPTPPPLDGTIRDHTEGFRADLSGEEAIDRRLAEIELFEAFDERLFALRPLEDEAIGWIAQFLRRYASIRAQLADAALVYLAERENVRTVFTLDRRDFSVYRLKRNRSLTILPDIS